MQEKNIIEINRSKFENMNHGGKKMNDIIEDLKKQREENLRNDESDNEDEYEETTTTDELKNLKAILRSGNCKDKKNPKISKTIYRCN